MQKAGARATLAPISMGLAIGLTAALYVFLLGLTAALFEWGMLPVQVLSNLFIGYSPTFVGSIAGAVWAFVDGLVAGIVIAVLYNAFVARRR